MSHRNWVFVVTVASSALLVSCNSTGGPTVRADSNPWFGAASSGSQADLDAALKSGASVNAHESRDRNSPLHVAAIAGNVPAVKFILANGGNPDALDEDGRTALMMAVYHSQGQAAVALINANAKLEIRDRQSNTALLFAARRGQVDAINAMIA